MNPTGRNIREPNLQNIPVRTPEGAAIKKAFVNSENPLRSVDLSKIEEQCVAHHLSGAQRLWDHWKDKYPFHCKTTTNVRPDRVPDECGPAVSVVLTPGIRTWGFKSPECLDTFKQFYGEHVR